MILALEREKPGLAAADFAPHLQAEAARAWELYQTGVVRQLYFNAESNSAVLLLECETTDKASEILATMPLVQVGLVTFEIIPLVPYSGFARLFEVHPPSSNYG